MTNAEQRIKSKRFLGAVFLLLALFLYFFLIFSGPLSYYCVIITCLAEPHQSTRAPEQDVEESGV